MKQILFYVNSHFGLGHFKRIDSIIGELRRIRPRVGIVVLHGGLSTSLFRGHDNLEAIQLPGLSYQSCDGLVSSAPKPTQIGRSLDAVHSERQNIIKTVFRKKRFDVIVLEYFPFSKQHLINEVHTLLSHVELQANGKIIVSLRDIITRDNVFNPEVVRDFIDKYVDWVLVHSDERIFQLAESYPEATALISKLIYTGFIVDDRLVPAMRENRNDTLVISVGGGYDGAPLIHMTLDALERYKEFAHLFGIQIFPGPYAQANDLKEYQTRINEIQSDTCINISGYNDYREAIESCTFSISMSGYNTTYELFSIGVPQIIMSPRNRCEQTLRANRLCDLGLVNIAQNADDIVHLLKVRNDVLPPCDATLPFNINGSRVTADILSDLIG